MDDQRKDNIDKKKKKTTIGTAQKNYRPIICLQMMWKMFTAQ